MGYACASGDKANDQHEQGQRISPYTKALVTYLGTTGDVRNDLQRVRNAVKTETASWEIPQVPVFSDSLGLECIRGGITGGTVELAVHSHNEHATEWYERLGMAACRWWEAGPAGWELKGTGLYVPEGPPMEGHSGGV